MAGQPTSMLGHMYAATRKTVGVMLAPVAFVGRAAMQAAERLIPQGAAELGQAIFTGNAYAPPGLTERLVPPDRGNVHGAGAGQATQAPAVAPPTPQPPVQQPTQAFTASTYYTPNHQAALNQAAARVPQARDNARER